MKTAEMAEDTSAMSANSSAESTPVTASSTVEKPKNSERNKKPKRRPFACKVCHGLKVKCIPSDPKVLTSPCVRCIKANRPCEIDAPRGRKKKRPEERVAELELRLEQLQNQLQQTSSPDSSTGSLHQSSPRVHLHQSSKSSVPLSQSPLVSGPPAAQRTVEFVNENEIFEQQQRTRLKLSKAKEIEERFGPGKLHAISAAVTAANEVRVSSLKEEPVDIINKGYITLEEAHIRFSLYQNDIYEQYPMEKIECDFETLRMKHSLLFTTLMAVAGTFRPTSAIPEIQTNLELVNLAQKQVLREVLLVGNKSMELFKSILLWTIFYNVPEMFHHRRYHVFSGLCISMCHDLGLTGRPYYVVHKNEGAFRRRSMVLDEPQKEEYRCLVLSVYSLTTSYMLFLRRKLPVAWTPYFEECFQLLKMSPDKRHRTVGVLAKLTSTMEKIDAFLKPHDDDRHPLIKHFIQEIDALKDFDTTMGPKVMKAYSSSIEAFLYSKFSSKELTYRCLNSTMTCIESFSEMTLDEMNKVPLLIFGRLMYCFALFLKTCNTLNYDFDLNFVDQLLDKLKMCSENFRNNHIVLKIRLLLHFYMTTFAKNEDVFNSINEVSSAYSIAKTVTETQAQAQAQAPPPQRPDLHSSSSVPNLGALLNGKPHAANLNGNGDLHHLSHPLSHPTHSDSAAMTHQLPLPSLGQAQLPPFRSPYAQGYAPMNMDPFSNGVVPITTGVLTDPNSDPVYPRIDMLSDAMMKGFVDVPTDLLNSQEDFWKLFDYKQDDQFYL